MNLKDQNFVHKRQKKQVTFEEYSHWFVFSFFLFNFWCLSLGENLNAEDLKPAKESVNEEHKSLMSLVKLTKSGLLLFTFPVDNSTDTTDIVSRVFQCVKSGALKAPV